MGELQVFKDDKVMGVSVWGVGMSLASRVIWVILLFFLDGRDEEKDI